LNPKNQNQTQYASPAMFRDKNYIQWTPLQNKNLLT
jgi:hypothetical protein